MHLSVQNHYIQVALKYIILKVLKFYLYIFLLLLFFYLIFS